MDAMSSSSKVLNDGAAAAYLGLMEMREVERALGAEHPVAPLALQPAWAPPMAMWVEAEVLHKARGAGGVWSASAQV